jgi:Uma2 family endonuclease
MATVATPMTVEEFLALPDDGTERWLINGELRERPMTKRNRFHSRVMICSGTALENWSRRQPLPRGEVFCGEAGVILQRDPPITVGVDLLYVSAELLARQTDACTVIEGIPTFIGEILSPNDTLEDVNEKIDTFMAAGVPLVWIIDPRRRTVTVYRPGREPEFVNVLQELSGDPELPGFRVPVVRLFEYKMVDS